MIELIISLLIFTAYVVFIAEKYGVQKSISMSYYSLPENRRWIFVLFIIGFNAPIVMLCSAGIPIMAVSAWMVMVVGSTCNFASKKWVKVLHMIGAVGGIVLANVGIILELHLWYITVILALAVGIRAIFNRDSLIWDVEILSFGAIWVALFLNFIL